MAYAWARLIGENVDHIYHAYTKKAMKHDQGIRDARSICGRKIKTKKDTVIKGVSQIDELKIEFPFLCPECKEVLKRKGKL